MHRAGGAGGSVSCSCPSSPPNACWCFTMRPMGEPRSSLTAVTVPHVRSFTTLYTLLKKTLFLQRTGVAGWLFSCPGCWAGVLRGCVERGSRGPWGAWAEELPGRAGRWGSRGAQCRRCPGISAQGKVSAEQHTASVSESQFSLPVQSLATAGC